MKKRLFFACWLMCQTLLLSAQLPKVVNVQDYPNMLDTLSSVYSSSLLTAADTNLTKTMDTWTHCLKGMEAYSKQIDFDVKGVKMWVKICWAATGEIDCIAYYLEDNSINIPKAEFEAFLYSFTKNYRLPIYHTRRFSYSSRVKFPLYLMYSRP